MDMKNIKDSKRLLRQSPYLIEKLIFSGKSCEVFSIDQIYPFHTALVVIRIDQTYPFHIALVVIRID